MLQCVAGWSWCPCQGLEKTLGSIAEEEQGPGMDLGCPAWCGWGILDRVQAQGSSCFLEENLVWILLDPPWVAMANCRQWCWVWVQSVKSEPLLGS